MRDKSRWYEGVPFGCGQCLPCRINKRRIWSLRMSLEFLHAKKAIFITLTYADENLPRTDTFQGTLCKRDLQLFFKRLRKQSGKELRYFACGEYGSKTHRPHYHAIVYGLDLDDAHYVGACWPHGLVHVGECTKDSIQYVAGYCLKKMVNLKDNPDDLTPEFTLSSRRPGIGAVSVAVIADALSKPGAREFFNIGDFDDDVPGTLTVLGKSYPVGRYIAQKLREALGVSTDKENFAYIESMRENFFEALRENSVHANEAIDRNLDSILAAMLVVKDEQKVANVEGKFKIFNKRNTI